VRLKSMWVPITMLVGTFSACQVMPGTEAYEVEKAKRAVANSLIDPSAAQFRNVQWRSGWVCGELNGKNRMGAFVGFRRFVVRTDTDQTKIDPEFSFASLLEAQELCRSLTGNSYASVSSTVSACDRAEEQKASQLLQASFDEDWSKHCAPVRSKPVYRPPLSDPDQPPVEVPPVEPEADAAPAPAAQEHTVDNFGDDADAEPPPPVDADGDPIDAVPSDDA